MIKEDATRQPLASEYMCTHERMRVCGEGLNENAHHGLVYLNAWSTFGGTVSEELGGVSLGGGFAVSKAHTIPS